MEAVLNTPPQQKALSLKLDTHMFQALVSSVSPANKTRMLSVSAPHASSWVSAIPSEDLNMHLDSEECQVAIRWWLGLKTSTASSCHFCPGAVLVDLLGHHSISCWHGGDVITRHSHLRDTFAKLCHRAHLPGRVEVGYGLSGDHINTRSADVLVQGRLPLI